MSFSGRAVRGKSPGRTSRVLGVAACALLAACGNRLPHTEIVSAVHGAASASQSGPSAAPAAQPGAALSDAPTPAAGGGVEAGPATSGAGAASPVAAATPAAGTAQSSSGAAKNSTSGAAGNSKTPASGPTATAPGTAAAPTTPAPAAGGPASTVVIGHIGSYAGIVGAAISAGRPTAQVWARSVNARGGLNGHPVRLIIADDGSDPARNLALAKDMIENQGAIMLMGNLTSLSTPGSEPYLKERGVPAVGGDMVTPLWHESPILFPQGTFINNIHIAAAKLAAAANHHRFGILYCGEATACTNSYKVLSEGGAKQAGVDLVYSAQISLAQPDFTSECLQARNNNVEALLVAADGATVARTSRSCAQQGFKPQFLAVSLAVINDLEKEPALEGLSAPVATFPWIASDTAAAREFTDTMRQYAPDVRLSGSASAVWTAGKLVEAATRHLSASPKPAEILAALWAMKGETLGGLAPPLTFHQGQGPDKPACYFVVRVVGGKWTAPNGSTPSC